VLQIRSLDGQSQVGIFGKRAGRFVSIAFCISIRNFSPLSGVLREQWISAIVLGLWGFIVVSTADGMVRSWVTSDRVKTNSLLITLLLMGGLAAFGPIGFFVGPVSRVVLASLLRFLREEHATVRGARDQVA